MKKTLMTQIIETAVIIINILMLMTVFKPCPNSDMSCNRATGAALVFMILMAIFSAVAAYLRENSFTYSALTVFLIIFNIAATCMPLVFGGCMKETMRCHVYTFPYIRAAFIVVAIIQLISIIVSHSEKVNLNKGDIHYEK